MAIVSPVTVVETPSGLLWDFGGDTEGGLSRLDASGQWSRVPSAPCSDSRQRALSEGGDEAVWACFSISLR